MSVHIHPIALGIDCCYVIQDTGCVMIDGGFPNQSNAFIKTIARLAIKPEEIQLIVLTHGHPDHIGSVSEIKGITGARIALHRVERDCLEKSLLRLPPGVTAWGRIVSKALGMMMPPSRFHIPSTSVDVVLGNEGLALSEYGIPGRVLYTPGHSMGSVSVLLETGEAFVGDLAMNMFPLRLGPGLPVLAEDFQKVKESWRLLLDAGVKTVYPGHGKPFSVDVIRRALR